ncbi:MAG TPA: acyl-CoA thioesterase II [Tianweitania sediminis]|nr:acyl-CoA thioesterase II [Tianweitania sediminis]
MSKVMQDLLDILDLETLELNLFRGRSPQSAWQRVFGGQVIGQALVAAQRTVDVDRHAHSLHGYFMRPGDPKVPIIYEVDRIRDGRSFTTRRVVAIQHGHAIFSLEASFQVDEPGLNHQFPMPLDVPAPETLESMIDLVQRYGQRLPENVRRFWARERPLDIRPVGIAHYTTRDPLPPFNNVWIKVNNATEIPRAQQFAMLAYVSDMTLLDTTTFPHGRWGFDPDIQMASLDHAMWFHRPPATMDQWFLYTQDTPSTMGARGFTRGQIFSRDGVLIASVAQEGLIRLHEVPASA